jgi:hypothetical protein
MQRIRSSRCQSFCMSQCGARSSECFLNLLNRMPMMPEGEPWDRTWRVESPVRYAGLFDCSLPISHL